MPNIFDILNGVAIPPLSHKERDSVLKS